MNKIKEWFKLAFSFKERMGRKDFIVAFLFLLGLNLPYAFLIVAFDVFLNSRNIDEVQIITFSANMLLFSWFFIAWSSLATSVKRFRDIGFKDGWEWCLSILSFVLYLTPIALLFLLFKKGKVAQGGQ